MTAAVSIDVLSLPAMSPPDAAMRTIVRNALLEDLAQGDVTTDNLPTLTQVQRVAQICVREACVVSGLSVAALAFRDLDPDLRFTPHVANGAKVMADQCIATVEGRMSSILKAERTALNFLQHLCGIATMTRRYRDALEGFSTRITNTRKTTPGLRLLERQAVIDGGGSPHRFNLGSAAMLKDNHLQAMEEASGASHSLSDATRILRSRLSHTMRIAVEVDRLEQISQALEGGADVILLDNMSPAQIREAVALIAGRAITEASGRITLETLREYAETGVDYISTSKITLGVPAIDIGLDLDKSERMG